MTLLVAATFALTFLVVCLLASFLLKRRGDPKRAPTRPGTNPITVRVDRRTRRSVLPVLLALVVTLGVVLGVIYALVTAVNHLDVLSFVLRHVPAVPRRFQWAMPQVLAAAILAIGLPLARRFRRPDRFRAGVVLVALAFATFWPLQYLAASFDLPFTEYKAALHALALFISVCLLTGGLETIRRASNTPHDDSWEFWRTTP